MNKNVVYIRGKKPFLRSPIAFLLVSIVTAGIVFIGFQGVYSTNKIDVPTSSETTYFYMDPPEVRDITPGERFKIKINVTDAPETYGWEIYLSWDSNILKLDYKKEGDFLHRGGVYETGFLSFPTFDEANLQGEIMIGCSLKGDVPWASGDGWLATLGFVVEAQGSSVLNLYKTRLWDYVLAGSPAETYYPNLDGFFYNEPFHNIAISNVTAHPSEVETGETVTINVTITNEGNYSETSETFNVTVYADITAYKYDYDPLGRPINTTIVIGDEITVGTQTVTEPLAPGANTTLTFTWNTTGVAADTYTISALIPPTDDDTRDNTFIDDTVTVAPAHDIAITNVTASPTEVIIGETVTINVTVKNEGKFNETFDVTVYYDDIAIENQTDITLTNGTSKTLPFTWDTTGVPEGTYTISAEASAVEGETDTADNTYTDGTVRLQEAPASNILIYATAGTAIVIIVAAILIYVIKFRK